MEGARTGTLHEAWRIARPYWFSDERGAERGLLTAVVAMNFAGVWITVRINRWQKAFHNALQNYNDAGALDEVGLWSQRLSGGEQQRLAFARVLLADPATIFLDEATAALEIGRAHV